MRIFAQLRNRISVTGTAIVAMLIMSGAGAAMATSHVHFTKPTGTDVLPSAADFATDRFNDPWDMNRLADLAGGYYFNDLTNISSGDGIFTAEISGPDPYFHLLFPGYRDAMAVGRDGMQNRINSAKYSRLAFKMRADEYQNPTAYVHWFYDREWKKFGRQSFKMKNNWFVYDINLAANPDWQGLPVGLRIDPSGKAGTTFSFDWVRLYQPSSKRGAVSWIDETAVHSGPGALATIYVDNDTTQMDGLGKTVTQAPRNTTQTAFWDYAPFPPDKYYFSALTNSNYLSLVYSPPLTLNQQPLINILDPDKQGGKDYAATVLGNPWDMNQASDVSSLASIAGADFSNGVMSGTTVNDGANYNDGYLHLRVPIAIDAAKYHRLTFRYRYDGPFDFGYGTMSRFIWLTGSPPRHQTLDDIVTYPEWKTYTIDLNHALLDSGTIGWKGKVKEFRFDPLEVPSRWRFYLDYVKLAADDTADKRFTVKWQDLRRNPRPTRVDLYYDNDATGYNGTLIAANLVQKPNVANAYTWNTSRVPAGKYYIYAVATDGVGTGRRYSTGPLLIRHFKR